MAKLNTYTTRGTGGASICIIDGVDKDGNTKIKYLEFIKGQKKPKLILSYYQTSDEKIQKAIENTRQFKIGQLKLKSSVKIDSESQKKDFVPITPVFDFSSIKTWPQAAEKLTEKFGIPAEELLTPEDIRAAASDNNRSFKSIPDW